jgi:RNA polymerase sigma-70 factor (ECF subfamily)
MAQAPEPPPPPDGDTPGASDRHGPAGLRQARESLQRVDRGDGDALAARLDPVAGAAAGGSPEALELLVWAVDELDLARAAIRRVLVDEADVDDVAQDVLVAVAEGIHGFRGDARFTTWLHQVARFKAIAFLRRKRPAEALPETERLGDAARISSMIASRTSIADVLRALPEEYREPVILRDLEHLPYDELARRLGMNINTAKTRVARGRALVAARLAVR